MDPPSAKRARGPAASGASSSSAHENRLIALASTAVDQNPWNVEAWHCLVSQTLMAYSAEVAREEATAAAAASAGANGAASVAAASSTSAAATAARRTMDRFFALYPTAAFYWCRYIQVEMKAKNFQQVEALFERALRSCYDLDLWRLYVEYVKLARASAIAAGNGGAQQQLDEDAYAAIEEAYEYALKNIGTTRRAFFYSGDRFCDFLPSSLRFSELLPS